MTITLYRAMCIEEAQKSLANQGLDFIRRYKWFSPSNKFITKRVRDGSFNNSSCKPHKYEEILAFEFTPESENHFIKQNEKEWKLDIRKAQFTRVLKIRKDLRRKK